MLRVQRSPWSFVSMMCYIYDHHSTVKLIYAEPDGGTWKLRERKCGQNSQSQRLLWGGWELIVWSHATQLLKQHRECSHDVNVPSSMIGHDKRCAFVLCLGAVNQPLLTVMRSHYECARSLNIRTHRRSILETSTFISALSINQASERIG